MVKLQSSIRSKAIGGILKVSKAHALEIATGARASRYDWPSAMRLDTAAAYLDYESPKVIEDLLRAGEISAFRCTENGERRILREVMDEFLDRKSRIPMTTKQRPA